MVKLLFSRRFIVATLIVIILMIVMVRLGFWQLDRLQQRRVLNMDVKAQLSAQPLNLNQTIPPDSNLLNMAYRSVIVKGRMAADQAIILRTQIWQGQLGYRIFTPLLINDSQQAVLVDQGWIPYSEQHNFQKYATSGEIELHGMIERVLSKPAFLTIPDPTVTPGESRLIAWNNINMDRLAEQSGFHFLPVYVVQQPDPGNSNLPFRALPVPDLSEGPHMSYAIQWFSFTAILAIGYPIFVDRRAHAQQNNQQDIIINN
jgi:surfeit locus 1 family protein